MITIDSVFLVAIIAVVVIIGFEIKEGQHTAISRRGKGSSTTTCWRHEDEVEVEVCVLFGDLVSAAKKERKKGRIGSADRR